MPGIVGAWIGPHPAQGSRRTPQWTSLSSTRCCASLRSSGFSSTISSWTLFWSCGSRLVSAHSMTSPRLTRLLEELAAANIEFILVGGLAAVSQGAPLVTFDVDVVHRRSDDNVDRLLTFL